MASPDRYDALVLGGGAGCALADRLSENPDRSVCLVEAGPDYGHLSEGRWPADILDPRWLALESHLWERDDEVPTRRSSGCASWLRSRRSGRAWRSAPRSTCERARGFFHPVGTCAIGSVLDERCRVLGFENLYVVDAAAIPEIQSANTNLTTVALAERAPSGCRIGSWP